MAPASTSAQDEAIPLSEKQVPTAELSTEQAFEHKLVRLRQSNIDISAIQKRIQKEGEKLWDPVNQKDNVPIQRAGHDKWGIGKVVFIFSDDYIHKVYTFPWFEQWKNELMNIFEQIHIPINTVIRCILACMPPGADIPTHHDTGDWVRYSHRMHVPIFTNDQIDFKVGFNDKNMIRRDFLQGNLYELNNASKHSVHNHSNHNRVHLIFDYVEESFPLNHVQLNSNHILHQTRRTLDLSTDYGSRLVPSFMIIGCQKAGTTSLYDYIAQHDVVVPAKRKETHYLDWRWNQKLPSIYSTEGVQAHQEYYHNFFQAELLLKCPSLITGEATPSYLLGGSIVIQRVKKIAPQCKFLVILRNPVDRAYSHFCMSIDTEGNAQQLRNRGHEFVKGKTFEEIVDEEIKEFEHLGVHPDMSFEEFDTCYLQKRMKFDHGGHSFLGRGLYALQLLGWFEKFSKEKIMVLTLDEMKKSTHQVIDRVFTFLELPPHRIEDVSPKNTRHYEPLSEITRRKLTSFFAPFNAKLKELLTQYQFQPQPQW